MLPLSSSMDHVGPLTRTVRDAALVMQVISDLNPDMSQSIAGRRIGIPQNFFNEGVAPAVQAEYESAVKHVEKLGVRLIPIKVPDPAAINTVARIIQLSEASALMLPYLDRRSDFGPDLLALLDQGGLISATDYVDAQRLRALYQKRWSVLWEEVDVIFTPTTPIQAPLIGQTIVADEDVRLASTRFVRPFNALGLPAISIPFGDATLPVGIQIMGQRLIETGLLRLAESLSNV